MTERDLPEDPQKEPAETVDALEERAAAERAAGGSAVADDAGPDSDDVAVGEDVRTAADEDEQVDGEPGSSSEPPA